MPACDTRLLPIYMYIIKPLFCITAKTACGYYLSMLLNLSLSLCVQQNASESQSTYRYHPVGEVTKGRHLHCSQYGHVQVAAACKKRTQFVLKTRILITVHCQVDVWLN